MAIVADIRHCSYQIWWINNESKIFYGNKKIHLCCNIDLTDGCPLRVTTKLRHENIRERRVREAQDFGERTVPKYNSGTPYINSILPLIVLCNVLTLDYERYVSVDGKNIGLVAPLFATESHC